MAIDPDYYLRVGASGGGDGTTWKTAWSTVAQFNTAAAAGTLTDKVVAVDAPYDNPLRLDAPFICHSASSGLTLIGLNGRAWLRPPTVERLLADPRSGRELRRG
jgi:hypothetical protein